MGAEPCVQGRAGLAVAGAIGVEEQARDIAGDGHLRGLRGAGLVRPADHPAEEVVHAVEYHRIMVVTGGGRVIGDQMTTISVRTRRSAGKNVERPGFDQRGDDERRVARSRNQALDRGRRRKGDDSADQRIIQGAGESRGDIRRRTTERQGDERAVAVAGGDARLVAEMLR
jgi:hypothetical protein